MKNILLTAVMLIASSTTLAATPNMPGGPGGMPGRPMAGPMRAGGGLTKMLDLTPDQEKQLEAAQMDNQKAMMPLQQERAKLIQELSALAEDPKSSDSDIKAKISALKENKKAIMAQQDKYSDKLAAILNPRQQAKLAALMEMHSMSRGPMGGGMGMQHPPMGGPQGAPGQAPAKPAPAPGTENK